MEVKPSDFYSEDYFFPKTRHYTDEFGVDRTYYGPSKEWDGFGLIVSFIKENFPEVTTISDIGCSAGSFTDHAIRQGFDSIGCDISRFAINNCVPGAKGKVRISDITKDRPVRQSHMAIALDLMEHIYEKDLNKAMDFITNSIVPNGYFFACIATCRHESELFQHSSENDPVPINKNWLAVSGHVNIKWYEDWMKIMTMHGFTPDFEKMFKFQLWRTRNDLATTESWSQRNVYIGRK